MFCEKCGAQIKDGMEFCANCGAPISQQTTQKEEKVQKQSNWKWIVGGIAGTAVLFFVVTVGILYAMGVFEHNSGENIGSGDKQEVASMMEPVQTKQPEPTSTSTPTPTPQSTETPTPQPDEQQSEEEEQYDEGEYGEDESDEGEYNEVASTDVASVTMENISLVEASSELSEHGMTHSADRICDGSLHNAWVEGASGQGIGENVLFTFDDTYCISGMKIYAGYQKSKDLYNKNSRPKKIEITFSDGRSKSFELKDHYGMQQIDFDEPVVSDNVRVTIKSVYKGKKYKDTVISEIVWY